MKRDLPFGRQRGDARPHLRADHCHDRAGEEQGVELAVGDLSPAHDEAGFSIQNECDWVTDRGHRCTDFPTFLAAVCLMKTGGALCSDRGQDRGMRTTDHC